MFLFIQEIVVTEILCRSAKHLFRNYIQSVPIHLLSFSISHFLNCFLTIVSSLSSDYLSDELVSSSSSTLTHNGGTNTNSSLSNSTNSSSQKSNNKKKNKKQQQRKQNPLMRNGMTKNRL